MANQVVELATRNTTVVSDDKKFFTRLSNLLDAADLLADLTMDDSQVGPLRKFILDRGIHTAGKLHRQVLAGFRSHQ